MASTPFAPRPGETLAFPGALVIGAGPAGLAAAEVLAEARHPVLIADAMPSPARKLLMAGKSGLNLTKAEARDLFHAAYGEAPPPALRAALQAFGPEEVMAWARGLGQEVFTGSTGRVFPLAWKASPLLRAWLARLDAQGVGLKTRWRWTGFEGDASRFDTPDGPRLLRAPATILALGGASWRRLGSDGAWAALFPDRVAPFAPSNMGLVVAWSPHMARHFGEPVKGAAWSAGLLSRGEVVVSARGLEGGGLYPLSRALREGAPLTLDLFPDLSEDILRQRLGTPGRESLPNRLRKRLGLEGVRAALLQEWGRPLPADLAPLLKRLPVRHDGPRPLDEAISTAGGLRFDALDLGLMLRDRPGTFAAGEMLDWEAPTGGYLLTASLATGRLAGRAASDWLARHGAGESGGEKAVPTGSVAFPTSSRSD
ncbi:MAG TPA: TIGR03862 family flavoprotein [Rubellimicrobium sp.]|nr:TIGR03862 family flavoprotein [Rubellimicrobium sp.]